MTETEVVVVGAGPTGLTLACDLARRGIACRIVERSTEPAQGSRGFTLKPRSLEALDDLGVADRVVAAAAVESRLRFHLGTERLFDLAVPPGTDPARPYPNPIGLPRWRTEALLRERLAELGERVEFGCRLTDITPDPDGVTATLANGETVRARYLVGSDGGRSTVRGSLGIPFPGRTSEDMRALLADVRLEGLDRDAGVHLWMNTDGHLVVARPTPHEDVWQVVSSLRADEPEPSLETLRKAVRAATGRSDVRVSDPRWLSVWRYNLRMVDTYRVGPVFLAGDAAHVHSPFGGHGMNTGIQDAYNLGWKLDLVLRGAASDRLLDTYQDERLPAARAILADSDRQLSGITPPRLLRPLLRLVLRAAFARQQRRTRDDHPTYRTGPLTVNRSVRRSPVRAGDVAPDAPILRDGKAARFVDVLRGPHFTVLAFGSAAVPELGPLAPHARVVTVGDGLLDPTGDLRRAYAATPDTTVVIRPDGYIGLLAHRDGGRMAADYARTVADSTGRPDRMASRSR
jgi:2-polyprenyl-6-methoxyphenol hydroxylase-like FAD-dependent oxidoreductase